MPWVPRQDKQDPGVQPGEGGGGGPQTQALQPAEGPAGVGPLSVCDKRAGRGPQVLGSPRLLHSCQGMKELPSFSPQELTFIECLLCIRFFSSSREPFDISSHLRL